MIRPAIDRKKDAADLAFKRHAYAVQNFQNEGGRGWRRTLCFWSGSSMDDFTREVIQATAVISINTMLPYAIWSHGGEDRSCLHRTAARHPRRAPPNAPWSPQRYARPLRVWGCHPGCPEGPCVKSCADCCPARARRIRDRTSAWGRPSQDHGPTATSA